MPLRYEVVLAGEDGYMVITADNFFSKYTLESIVGCEGFLRELCDYIKEYHVEPDLPTTPDAAWELFLEACLNPDKLSDSLRARVLHAYLGPLSVTIPRSRPEGTRRAESRWSSFNQRWIIIHDERLFGLIYSREIVSLEPMREREPASAS